jgi:glycosyltransferase involved in cell wall biosynthesis
VVLRVFIIPSWCPTKDDPISGIFFVEQAEEMARMRPDWIIAFCGFDLSSSRFPWRLSRFPKFFKDCLINPRIKLHQTKSGIQRYDVWSPYLPRFGKIRKWQGNTDSLEKQIRPALVDFIKRFGKPDLIHARSVYPGGIAATKLGKEFGIPVGITEHLGPFPGKQLSLPNGSPIPLISQAYTDAKSHSADGTKLASQLISMRLASEVEVIPNFLPETYGSEIFDNHLSDSLFTFLSIGGPSYAKGTDILLMAFSLLNRNARLKIAGNSPEAAEFKKMAIELGIDNKIQWMGRVSRPDILKLLKQSSCFVLPSRGENFGVVYIEALAHGKPLIATRCGGPEDIVNSLNGLLVPMDDPVALASAMEDIYINIANYKHQDLRDDFLDRFSSKVIVNKIENWYLRLVNSNPAQ